MNIQDILEEAEKVAAYMNANVPDTMGYENMRTLLDTYFETNSSILEIGPDSLLSCMFCHCKSRSECDCECTVHLDVSGGDLCVAISTWDGLVIGDGPQGNKFGGCCIRKNGALFFVIKIFDDNCHDVWHREYNYDDYWFQEP
jgi:hypothetical protein